MSAIELIQHEREFKVLCDGLLRFEIGRLVQTYASSGRDGGVDADYNGSIDGFSGHWVFQYKFRSASASLQGRRTALMRLYRGSKNKRSEFDSEGVRHADGYILLTNVPVTASMVQELKEEWHKRRSGAHFCVWDPSRLTALLRGHEHLARSWTGVREAHCQKAIILPLWQWLQGALQVAANWMNDPLWPLSLVRLQRRTSTRTFQEHHAVTSTLAIGQRENPLRLVECDPEFRYAASVVYPRALAPFSEVRRALEELAGAVMLQVDAMCAELVMRLPQLDRFATEELRTEVTRVLAYCVLEKRWGFPQSFHFIRDGRLKVEGNYSVWEGEPSLPDIAPILDTMVAAAEHGVADEPVVAARAQFEQVLRGWWERLWHVAAFGLDAEDIPTEHVGAV